MAIASRTGQVQYCFKLKMHSVLCIISIIELKCFKKNANNSKGILTIVLILASRDLLP